jgi:putative acetyltransferase
MVIRDVSRADVPEVLALIRAVLAEFGLGFGEGSATDAELEDLPDSYSLRGGRFWIARDDAGRLLGTAGGMPLTGGDVELRKMYLAPAARGRGVGRALLETALTFARAAGAAHMVLDTTDAMRAAIALYERAGFVRDDSQIRAARCSRGYRKDLGEPPASPP